MVIGPIYTQNYRPPLELVMESPSGLSSCTSIAAAAAALILITLCAIRALGLQGLGRKKIKKQFPPVASTIFHQLLNFKTLHDFQTELFRKHKTFRVFSPLHNQTYTTDPANIEYFLRTNFKNYGKGLYAYGNLTDLLGDGIFAVDGDKWKQQRKLASYQFSTKVLRNFSGGIFKINAAKLADIVDRRGNAHEAVDIQDLFMKSTMDSIFKVGFGVDLNSLKGSEEGSRFSKAFNNSSVFIMRRYVDPFWKLKRLLCIGHEAELRNHIKVIDEFVYKLINNRLEMASSQGNDSVKQEDLLSRFIAEMKTDPENMTPKYLRDIILNFLIAGKDTTAGTLSWFIYMLCKHPSVQEKIAREVEESVRNDEPANFAEFAGSLTDAALDKMQYLHATLTETLRLYPSVPRDSKVCFSDDTLPDGFSIRKGDIVTYHPYAMGRMKYLWGDDAEMFRPERWIDADGFFQPDSPFKFTAFQAGPRICLGKEFAYRQMKIFAAVLLRFFTFKLINETDVVTYRTMITLYIDQGLHVHALRR